MPRRRLHRGLLASRPQDDDEDEEEEDSESGTGTGTDSDDDSSGSGSDDSGDGSSGSDTGTEPEAAVNPPPTAGGGVDVGQAMDAAIDVGDTTEEEEEEEEEEGGGGGGGEKESGVRVEKGWKGQENVVGVEAGDNSAMPTCPVCMEPWTSEGPHRVCCIPCGHVYGRLCLEKWLRKLRNKGKCPQCNQNFLPKQIINLYAPRIVVPNDDLEKEASSLREKNESLTLEKARLLEELRKQREQLEEEQRCKKQKIRQTSLLEFSDQRQLPVGTLSGSTASSPARIVLQIEMPFDGARVMVIDASNYMLMVSSKAPGIPGEHMLNKVSLLCPSEIEKVRLPNNTKTVKDICILPNGLVALASLGRKLAVFSTTSNNFVLQYDLPVIKTEMNATSETGIHVTYGLTVLFFGYFEAPAWSCSGNDGNDHHIYAGLQNGKLLVFDVRQTAQPIQSLDGLTNHPIHTVHALNYGDTSKILTASSAGPCLWDIDQGAEKPTMVPGLESHGVCISLARGGDNIVATYRPRIDLFQPDTVLSQTINSSSSPASNPRKVGSHILLKKSPDCISFCKDQVGYGYVSEVRMSKSAIICSDEIAPLFAYGDEMLCGIRTWGLPSFIRHTDLNPHKKPLLDLRYARGSNSTGFLGCLSEEKLQVFRCS